MIVLVVVSIAMTMSIAVTFFQLHPRSAIGDLHQDYLLGGPETRDRSPLLSPPSFQPRHRNGDVKSPTTPPTILATLGGGIEDEDLAAAPRKSGNRSL